MTAPSLIERLKEIEDSVLPSLLRDKNSMWNTLDVIYHPPHVERCWFQLDDIRLFLHCIHPAEDPSTCLAHPHAWPSAMKIVSGQYIHDVGHRPTPPDEVQWMAQAELAAGTYYEMSNPEVWHRVCPIGREAYTLMISGKPYEEKEDFPKPEKKQPRLKAHRRDHILHVFRELYCPEYRAEMDKDSWR